MSPNPLPNFFFALSVVLLFATSANAFGAGDIPDFSYLNDKAFRHGDIENVLENLIKGAGGAAAGGGLLGFAKKVLDTAGGGSKFSKNDIKKVYFGNWLRDYSQAMDIAGLSKLTAPTIVLVVRVLAFMTFGFATEEFEVTADRLGVYLCTEHIDNPKGYAEKEGDAREYHPKLRPPVDPRELEIDERTGMKKYMATEDEGFDTSTALLRRTFRSCIEKGREAGGREGADLWEAYRLLGTGLHTMEDLLAHSNWCELALRKMGHSDVFPHVGDEVLINTPNGEAPPLVTGTFGGPDFLHSMMGEATDHISQASVTDLSKKMDEASQNSDSNISGLKAIFSKLPIGGGDEKSSQADDLEQKSKAYNFNADDIAPQEVQDQLWEILKWRDGIYREVLAKIEMVPGLDELLESLTNALNAYVYTVLAPYITPILQQATSALGEGSKAVIDTEDQYEVFTNSRASDPSHSLLSKDHFQLILNEPAGKIAQVVVENSVNLIVQAWGDNSDPDQIINSILEAFHHPYYANGQSQIQHKMFDTMEKWFGGLGGDEGEQVLQALTKESVREGKNKRQGSDDETSTQPSGGYGGSSSGGYGGSSGGGYGGSSGGGYNTGGHQQSSYNSGDSYGRTDESNTYNSQSHGNESYGGSNNREEGYGSHSGGYGGRSEEYGGRSEEYGGRNEGYEGRREEHNSQGYEGRGGGYGGGSYENRDESSGGGYGGRGDEHESHRGGYEGRGGGDYENRGEDYGGRGGGYGGHSGGGYERDEPRHESYGRDDNERSGYAPSYDRRDQSEQSGYNPGYGSQRENDYNRGSDEPRYGESYGGGEHHRGHRDNDETFGAERLNINEGYGSRGGDEYGSREGDEYGSREGNEYGSRESEYGSRQEEYGSRREGDYGDNY